MRRRRRKKTFIVYEESVTQVHLEKNKKVRSWFEVFEALPFCVPPPPLFKRQLDFGIVPIKYNQRDCVKAVCCILQNKTKKNIYPTSCNDGLVCP